MVIVSATIAWSALTVTCFTTIWASVSMVVEPFGQHQNRPRRLVGKLEIFRSRLEGEARDLLAPIYGWFTEGFDTLRLELFSF